MRQMTVVHIGYKYGTMNTGGAAIAATRLHKALLEHGVESHYVCIWKCEDGQNVHVLPKENSIARKIYFVLTKITRCGWHFTSYRKSIPLNIVPLFGLNQLLDQIKPDIVHIHWINLDVMSFDQLAKVKYKVVLNLHDLYMINIILPHPGGDRRYIEGVFRGNASRLERWIFNRKRESVLKATPILIGPSRWVCECARKSIIGADLPAQVIPNLIDKVYCYNPSLCNEHERFIVLFGAYGGRKNRYKGFADLEKALELLPREVKEVSELWVFGEDATDCIEGGVRTVFKGHVFSPDGLIALYHQADIFAFPSEQETQGMTKIEALLCGLPVLVFNRTACAEGVVTGVNGWIANDGDVEGYAIGILHFFDLWKSGKLIRLREKISREAQGEYGSDKALSQMVNLYCSAIANHITK